MTLTGATGLIGRASCALRERGDEVTVLSRDPAAPRRRSAPASGRPRGPGAPGRAPAARSTAATPSCTSRASPSPSAGTTTAKQRIRDSREVGTRNLVAGLRAADPRPAVLVSSSARRLLRPHGDEELAESTPPGDDFLAEVCVVWEREADAAAELGVRVVHRPHRRRARRRRAAR